MKNEPLVTERLVLRPANLGDLPELSRLRTIEAVRKHLGGPLEEKVAEEKAREHIGKPGFFVVTLKENEKILGLCSLDAYRTGDVEVSYEFFPEAWGQGFGQEAVSALIEWGFANLKIPRIIAVTQANNVKSRALLERVGMTVVENFEEFGEPQAMYAINRG